ncbi:hypothetical protein Godav_013977 [Gossypium davidsonii]|uniref:Uncharacterized protein n=2 Tax=Gossypium TaxID=3633 RepID=A0A7J8RJM3_GOSDV|nr:hypothetical protein [Gossypium davidsonii]MBA0670214.1 hypothetical protein [Gossypium klotzschianum]
MPPEQPYTRMLIRLSQQRHMHV